MATTLAVRPDTTVYQYSTDPTPVDGCTMYTLTATQETQFAAVLAQPRSGITFDGTTFTALPVPEPPGPPPTPTVTAGSGTGGGAAVFVASPIQPSSDLRGTIDVTVPTGATPTPDANGHYELAVVAFGTTFPAAPVDVMTTQPSAASQALGRVFGDHFATTGFSLLSTNAPAAGVTVRIGYALA